MALHSFYIALRGGMGRVGAPAGAIEAVGGHAGGRRVRGGCDRGGRGAYTKTGVLGPAGRVNAVREARRKSR